MYIQIQPLQPIIARDSRPLTIGGKARTLNWIYPSVIVGTIRTIIAKELYLKDKEEITDKEEKELIENIKIKGPFLCKKEEIYFPFPKDIHIIDNENYIPLKPEELKDDEKWDLKFKWLSPIYPDKDKVNEINKKGIKIGKPKRPYEFWSLSQIIKWLTQEKVDLTKEELFIKSIPRENRIHIKISSNSYTTEEGHIFSTQGLCFPEIDIPSYKERKSYPNLSIIIEVKTENNKYKEILENLAQFHSLGGKKRLSYFKNLKNFEIKVPEDIKNSLKNTKYIRMILVTPGVFKNGWYPDWLDENLEGEIPLNECKGVKLRLKGAIIDRWKAISGWDLKKKKPKKIRRLVPEGSVYFFEIIQGETQKLTNLWLNSICSDTKDINDGFGIVVLGKWNKK